MMSHLLQRIPDHFPVFTSRSPTVKQKLAALLITVTVADDCDRFKALVKRVHIIALKIRFKPKKIFVCFRRIYHEGRNLVNGGEAKMKN